MNTHFQPWTYVFLAFGGGLVATRPQYMLTAVFIAGTSWLAIRAIRSAYRHRADWRVILPLAGDSLVLSLLLGLLLGVLWLLPPTPAAEQTASFRQNSAIIQHNKEPNSRSHNTNREWP